MGSTAVPLFFLAMRDYQMNCDGDINITGAYCVNSVPVGFTKQTVVTASRAVNTVYQNTGGKPLIVMACWNFAGKTDTLSFLSDEANPPVTEVAQIANTASQASSLLLFCIVLPGNYYQCSSVGSAPALISWVEYS